MLINPPFKIEKRLLGITLNFENQEKIKFSTNDFNYIGIYGVQQNIKMLNHNDIPKMSNYASGGIDFRINGSANKEDRFLTEHDEKMTPFSRIMKYNDITEIDLQYNDRTTENIKVPYCSFNKEGDESSLQETDIRKDNFRIKIHPYKKGERFSRY